jgi:hypothetical protein
VPDKFKKLALKKIGSGEESIQLLAVKIQALYSTDLKFFGNVKYQIVEYQINSFLYAFFS